MARAGDKQLEFKSFKSPLTQTQAEDHEEGGRFVAGEQFYDYENYGGLRKGGAVRLWAPECWGLAAATFSSCFSYYGLQTVLRPILTSQLKLTTNQNLAVQRLVELPMALGFLIGLLSDCYPLWGLRRKAYMIVGLVLNGVSVLTIAGLGSYLESLDAGASKPSGIVSLIILMSSMASFGCMFTYLCVHTRVIELSQREPLGERGKIQADYLMLRRVAQLFGALFTYCSIGSSSNDVHLKLSNTTILLAVICVLPLPVILKFWKEDIYSLACSMKIRSGIFWKIMQQKAVWRVLVFIIFFSLFPSVKFGDSFNVVRNWAHADKDSSILLRVIQDSTVLVVVIVWRQCFMNRPWRWVFCWVPIMLILPQLVISILICFDITRDRYVYRIVYSLTGLSDGANALMNIVPLTEIIQEGSEGVTVGLVLSLQRLVGIFVGTSTANIFRGDNIYDPAEVPSDSSHVRSMVLVSLLVNYLINALTAGGLFFLPSQKLDAQQLRMYGGFTSFASVGIVAFSLTLFFYSTAINVMTFVPSMACMRVVGGPCLIPVLSVVCRALALRKTTLSTTRVSRSPIPIMEDKPEYTPEKMDFPTPDKDVPKMFVAGSHFYNYEMYGGLRAGGKARLLTRKYIGLTVSAFASAYVYVGVRYGLLPLLGAHFGLTGQQFVAVDRLVELPATFCFLVGLIADSYPLFGYHRKSYMVVGILISFLALAAIALCCCFEDSLRRSLGAGCSYLIIALLGVVSFGSMINFTSVHTMVIMLSQQETLGERGITQANYLFIRISAQLLAQLMTFCINQAEADVQLAMTLTMLISISLGAIPMIINFLQEEEAYVKRAIKENWTECWKLTQQKAVWRIICFVSICALCMSFKLSSGSAALQRWSTVSATGSLLSYVFHDCVMLTTIFIWRTFFMNALWKRVFAIVPASAILFQGIVGFLIAFNVTRSEVFYVFGYSLMGVPHGILSLTTLVPVTEIVQEGMEGSTVGLAIAFDKLCKIFISTFLGSLRPDAFFSQSEVVADTTRVRWLVMAVLGLGFLVNALTFISLPMLPLQKLDAQQLRTFGGFSKGAGFATAIIFVLLFFYCALLNSLSFFPSTACLQLAGGSGCH
ncbi:TPA: hypothetical protein N0F65_012855 [Lagenidium giganteum]|uniref:Transmembrane protein n=1 Tax=Lagenidium giganteum TaxID=4803 RepID=A0AAV2YNC9_9STRA|nr:TPA: hypothetical protein N0F65_012855 [Lagenidium giganteum]